MKPVLILVNLLAGLCGHSVPKNELVSRSLALSPSEILQTCKTAFQKSQSPTQQFSEPTPADLPAELKGADQPYVALKTKAHLFVFSHLPTKTGSAVLFRVKQHGQTHFEFVKKELIGEGGSDSAEIVCSKLWHSPTEPNNTVLYLSDFGTRFTSAFNEFFKTQPLPLSITSMRGDSTPGESDPALESNQLLFYSIDASDRKGVGEAAVHLLSREFALLTVQLQRARTFRLTFSTQSEYAPQLESQVQSLLEQAALVPLNEPVSIDEYAQLAHELMAGIGCDVENLHKEQSERCLFFTWVDSSEEIKVVEVDEGEGFFTKSRRLAGKCPLVTAKFTFVQLSVEGFPELHFGFHGNTLFSEPFMQEHVLEVKSKVDIEGKLKALWSEFVNDFIKFDGRRVAAKEKSEAASKQMEAYRQAINQGKRPAQPKEYSPEVLSFHEAEMRIGAVIAKVLKRKRLSGKARIGQKLSGTVSGVSEVTIDDRVVMTVQLQDLAPVSVKVVMFPSPADTQFGCHTLYFSMDTELNEIDKFEETMDKFISEEVRLSRNSVV